jgi:hypothetical protein
MKPPKQWITLICDTLDRWFSGLTESLLSPLYKGTVFGASSCTEGVEPIAEVKRFLSAVWFTILTVDALLFAADCRV